MELSSFTSFIEMGATLTIAFVAVEYTKQYTCLIAQKVFDYFGRIKNIVLECKKTIDEDTIDGLSSLNIDGCNTDVKIEGLKRCKEKTLQEIDDKENFLNTYVFDKCNSKSHSSLSLFVFLFSVTSLFIAGFKAQYVGFFWLIVVLLSLLYTLSSWIFGEKRKYKYWFDYSSFKCVLITYFSVLLIGVIVTCIQLYFLNLCIPPYFYDIASYVTLFLPYVNFVVFAFIIRSKSIDIYKMIDETFQPLKVTCCEIQKETERLSVVKDLALEIKGAQIVDNTDIEAPFSQIKENPILLQKKLRRKPRR